MFTANQTFKAHRTAMKILKRYLNCRKCCAFKVTSPARKGEQSLAAWVTLSPVSQRWEIHFRSNILSVCDFRECETFNRFIDEKSRLRLEKKAKKDRSNADESLLCALQGNTKYWIDILGAKKHVNDKRVAVMQQMVENQEPLSRDAKHIGGDIDGLMAKLFGRA